MWYFGLYSHNLLNVKKFLKIKSNIIEQSKIKKINDKIITHTHTHIQIKDIILYIMQKIWFCWIKNNKIILYYFNIVIQYYNKSSKYFHNFKIF